MLRFIFACHRLRENGMRTVVHYTVDVEQPLIEAEFRNGGSGESSYEYNELVGVEVLEEWTREAPDA